MRRRRVSFSSDPRWTALKRAGLAVTAALALLVAVLWFGDSSQPPRPPSESANVAPEQSGAFVLERDTFASEPDATAQTADKPVEIPAPVVEEAAVTPEVTEAAPQAVLPPKSPETPAKSSKKTNGSTKSSSNGSTKSSGNGSTKLSGNGATQSPKPAAAPAKSVSLPDGYFVQLGVFDDTDNTGRVFDNAVALGLPAHVQSRVMVGPFRNKREAEAARDRLKNIAEGVVLPPQKTAKADENPKAKSRRRAK